LKHKSFESSGSKSQKVTEYLLSANVIRLNLQEAS